METTFGNSVSSQITVTQKKSNFNNQEINGSSNRSGSQLLQLAINETDIFKRFRDNLHKRINYKTFCINSYRCFQVAVGIIEPAIPKKTGF